MKTTKKVIAVLIAVAIICGVFAACGGNNNNDGKYKIGVIQLVEHVALDAAIAKAAGGYDGCTPAEKEH